MVTPVGGKEDNLMTCWVHGVGKITTKFIGFISSVDIDHCRTNGSCRRSVIFLLNYRATGEKDDETINRISG